MVSLRNVEEIMVFLGSLGTNLCDSQIWIHVMNSEPPLVDGPLGGLPSVESPCSVPHDVEGTAA